LRKNGHGECHPGRKTDGTACPGRRQDTDWETILMSGPKILGISGSLRKGSYNSRLLLEAVRLFGDCGFTQGSIHMPLYDGDLEDEEGVVSEAELLASQIAAADAIIIATPEYNQNLPGGLKNALDWVSRTEGAPWKGKPVAILSAAAGRAGGARSQFSLRHCLTPFNPRVLQGPEVMISGASREFDDTGRLLNPRYIKTISTLMSDLRAMI
jgi:chromate reductase, NAD(P)H dehydrogenase (quinone)